VGSETGPVSAVIMYVNSMAAEPRSVNVARQRCVSCDVTGWSLGVDDVIVVVFLGHVERQETGANAAQGCPRREYDVIRRSSTDSAHHRRKPVDLLQSALP